MQAGKQANMRTSKWC